jgi:hypothetical protein
VRAFADRASFGRCDGSRRFALANSRGQFDCFTLGTLHMFLWFGRE